MHPSPGDPWLPDGRGLPSVALAAMAYFVVNFLLVGTAVALHARSPYLRTLRANLPYQAFANFVLLSAAPLIAVVVSRSPMLLVLFLLPLTAVYVNAEISMQREHQAHHDELTGLSNRKLLVRKTEEALAEAARSGRAVGFLLLDLDRFKEVNDTLGHPAGDRLLRLVAHRLTHSVRPGDIVARLGGDEFAVLLPPVREVSAAREVAARLRAAIAEPIRLEGMSIEIEASVGLSLYPDDATGFELLMQHADVAMYLAKERRTGVERYVADSDRNSPARLALLGDLRRGIDRGELELQFQPKVFLADRRIAGMEALVRWRHPVRGTMRPDEFIPLVEHSYLMHDLTARVVDMALAQAAQWRRDGLPVQVSLNVAARDLIDAGLAETISRGLARTGLPPDVDPAGDQRADADQRAGARGRRGGWPGRARHRAQPRRLRHRLLLAGPAQAAAGQRGEDRLVVHRPGAGVVEDEVIVRSIVDLVHALGIRCVAEGVESAEVAAVAAGDGLRRRSGLVLQQAAERRFGHRVAGGAWRARQQAAGPVTAGAAGPADGRPPVAAGQAPVAAGTAPSADGHGRAAVTVGRPVGIPRPSPPAPRPGTTASRPGSPASRPGPPAPGPCG